METTPGLSALAGASLSSLAAIVVVLGVTAHARQRRRLSRSGAAAAILVGGIAAAAGWRFAAVLLVFFVTATALSRLGAEAKRQLTGAIVEKGSERDAVQVFANGGVFAAAALLSLLWPHAETLLVTAAAGAIAAACADTWSTEIGTLSLSPPRSIVTGRVVPPGTSGGVSRLGYAGTIAGASVIGVTSLIVGWPTAVALACTIGGMVGALADSYIGALWQLRRHCPACNASTERTIHDCGASTVPAGGLSWLDNDGVNALCTVIGACAAAGVWTLL